MDDICDTRDTLAVGTGERLHDWRIHSYTAGYCSRCGADQNHSGTKTSVNEQQVVSYPGNMHEPCNRMIAHLKAGGKK